MNLIFIQCKNTFTKFWPLFLHLGEVTRQARGHTAERVAAGSGRWGRPVGQACHRPPWCLVGFVLWSSFPIPTIILTPTISYFCDSAQTTSEVWVNTCACGKPHLCICCIGSAGSDPASQQTSSGVANFSDCLLPNLITYLHGELIFLGSYIMSLSFNSGCFTATAARCKRFPQRSDNRENTTSPSLGKIYEA